MGKVSESFWEKIVWPLLLLALTPSVTLIGSKLQSGDWLTWLKRIPSLAFGVFFGVVIFWVIIGVVVRRIKHLKARNLPSLPLIYSIPSWGYITVGTLNYKNVLWRCRIRAPSPWERNRLTKEMVHSERVDIETPPHCPKCDTELEEQETFFGNYRWSCLRCGFSQKNGISFYHEAVRAEKLAQTDWEKNQ